MTQLLLSVSQGIYGLAISAFGMCAAQWTPGPTQRQIIDACHRSIVKSVREMNREITKQKTVQSSLASQIRALVAKNGPNARRDILAKAYELRFNQNHSQKLYTYCAQLARVANEMGVMKAQLLRQNAIVESTNLMRIMAAIQPPSECVGLMREFSLQMQKAGLVDETVTELFTETTEDTLEMDDVEIDRLIADICTNKPQTIKQQPIVIEKDESVPDEDDDDNIKEDAPEIQIMEKRLEALRS
jgi:charged multivesicular body protein 3